MFRLTKLIKFNKFANKLGNKCTRISACPLTLFNKNLITQQFSTNLYHNHQKLQEKFQINELINRVSQLEDKKEKFGTCSVALMNFKNGMVAVFFALLVSMLIKDLNEDNSDNEVDNTVDDVMSILFISTLIYQVAKRDSNSAKELQELLNRFEKRKEAQRIKEFKKNLKKKKA